MLSITGGGTFFFLPNPQIGNTVNNRRAIRILLCKGSILLVYINSYFLRSLPSSLKIISWHFPGRNRDDEKLIVTIPPIRCGIAPDIRSTAAVTGIREYDERERTEPSLIPIIKTQTPDNYCSGNKNRGTGGHSSERKLHISITERLRSRNFHIRRVRLRLRNAHTMSSYHKTLAPREKFHTGKPEPSKTRGPVRKSI